MTQLDERAVVKYNAAPEAQGTSAAGSAGSPATSGGDAKATRNQPLTLREFVLWSVVPGLIPNAVVALMVGGAVKPG